MDGKFPIRLDGGFMNKEQFYQWLNYGDTEGEAETVVASQDQAPSTNYFKGKKNHEIRSRKYILPL
jgi:hypothetical protein